MDNLKYKLLVNCRDYSINKEIHRFSSNPVFHVFCDFACFEQLFCHQLEKAESSFIVWEEGRYDYHDMRIVYD